MSPKKLTTRASSREWARDRRDIGAKYLEVAQLVDGEAGAAVNVCVGVAVLAGIAAGDAICAAALGQSYSGADHAAAAALLERVDRELGQKLRSLVSVKPAAHYGNTLLNVSQRKSALRAAAELVEQSQARVI